ncbi:MAG: type VI secretion system baseplate subunit TssK [Planctomycetota bacterium]
MSHFGEVHWHEGVFLQPHHLQTMQRGLLARIAGERRAGFGYPYGVVETRLTPESLENLVVRFDGLKAVMPSGALVDYPEGAELPPLEFKDRFEGSTSNITVLLGVPVWYPSRANTIELGSEDTRAKRMWRVAEAEIHDENTGENPWTLPIRRANARLLFDDDDQTDMETIPLMRIARASGEDGPTPRVDTRFAPPSLLLRGSAVLREQFRDLAAAVEAARRELVVLMTRGGFNMEQLRGDQLARMLKLRTLNRYAGTMPTMVESPGTTPLEAYLCMRELLGELAGLDPATDPFQAPAYDHDRPGAVFFELTDKIRSLLGAGDAETYLRLKFAKDGPIYTASMSDEHLEKPSEYFLGIKGKEDPQRLAEMVEDADGFKFTVKTMWQARVFGVKLEWERMPPVSLPAEAGLQYFRLKRADSKRMWDRISEEREVAVWWPEAEASDYEVTLFMTV